MTKLHLFFILLLFTTQAFSQVAGCTDRLANNYNNAATLNNGSCTYNATSYSPALKTDSLSSILLESSGLQMANNDLWTFNDRGGLPALYKIDSLTGATPQTVNLAGASNVDWEDIAFDGSYFYIGDFGNNENGNRTDLKIYKFPIAIIPPHSLQANFTVPADQVQVIGFTYADQPQPPVVAGSNNTRYDCEAMLVDSGKIHLFTKDWTSLTTTHYIINSTNPGSYTLSPVEVLATGYLVTAADKAPGQHIIALFGYQNSGFGQHFMHLLSDYKNGLYFNGNKRKLDLPSAVSMGQGEGITFRDDSTGYISNEKFNAIITTVVQKLRTFNIGSFISSFIHYYTFSGNGNWSTASNWKNNSVPPAVLPANSAILIDPAAGGECRLDIIYTVGNKNSITVAEGKKFVLNGNLQVQ